MLELTVTLSSAHSQCVWITQSQKILEGKLAQAVSAIKTMAKFSQFLLLLLTV